MRGLYSGSLDGVLGPQTKQALSRFQQESGLAGTASLDAQTWEALTAGPEATEGSSRPSGTAGPASNAFGNSAAGR
jgi:peptidoglycan hydrolase-like protein with peptidoglycan-binding domain